MFGPGSLHDVINERSVCLKSSELAKLIPNKAGHLPKLEYKLVLKPVKSFGRP
jgi:hypothetical protein